MTPGPFSGSDPREGYYAYQASMELGRPLCLIALPGVGHRRVAYTLSALTGLPFADLDRWIEHDLGKSLWRGLDEDGPAHLGRVEGEALDRALSERPCGIIALGHGTLLARSRLRAVLEQGQLVYLETDPADAYWRLRQRARPLWSPYLPEPLGGLDDLRHFFAERRAHYEQAPVRLDVRGRSRLQIVESVRQAALRLDPALGP